MSVRLTLAAIAMTLLAAPAFASDKCNEPSEGWMSKEALRAQFEAKGYKVHKIKVDDGCYEVYASNDSDARIEVYVNPRTGETVRAKVDD